MKLSKVKLTFDEQNVISEAIWKCIIAIGIIIAIASIFTLIFSK